MASKRGFAAMDPERQREIASKGGKLAHVNGKAHEFTSDEARAAGKKGGDSISRDREHMARIGSRGGQARAGKGKKSAGRSSGEPSGLEAGEE